MKVTLKQFDSNVTLPPPWQTFVKGNGALEATGNTLRFVKNRTSDTAYTNAQIDDYQNFKRKDFLWRAPLQMTVKARFSHEADALRGTAGFGFWNDPFMMTGGRSPALPRAIWFFFSSPPSNMKLNLHTPGSGWKAATLDALRWPFFALLPTAPLAIPLMNIDTLYRTFWPIGQRAINVSESILNIDMPQWHTYKINWQEKIAQFYVDDKMVLNCKTAPGGPLGFVMWLDNQYMEVTPWGRFKYGLIDTSKRQWMEIEMLEIKS